MIPNRTSQLPVSGNGLWKAKHMNNRCAKQNAETLQICKQQNASETPEHRTPAEALTQPNSSEAKTGTAPGKILYKLLCNWIQRFRRDRPANAVVWQERRSTCSWPQNLCNGTTGPSELLNDLCIVVEQAKTATDRCPKCSKLTLWTRALGCNQNQLNRQATLFRRVDNVLQISWRCLNVAADHQVDHTDRFPTQMAKLQERRSVSPGNLSVRSHPLHVSRSLSICVQDLVPIQHNCRTSQFRNVLLDLNQRRLVFRPQIRLHTWVHPSWGEIPRMKTKRLCNRWKSRIGKRLVPSLRAWETIWANRRGSWCSSWLSFVLNCDHSWASWRGRWSPSLNSKRWSLRNGLRPSPNWSRRWWSSLATLTVRVRWTTCLRNQSNWTHRLIQRRLRNQIVEYVSHNLPG